MKNCKATTSGAKGGNNRSPLHAISRVITLLVLAALLLTVTTACGSRKDEGEKFDWDRLTLSSMLPKPAGDTGKILTDSEDTLNIYIYKTDADQYTQYQYDCEDTGFTLEKDSSSTRFSAFNEDGYKLSLMYLESDSRMDIKLTAPDEAVDLTWPAEGLGAMVPAPANLKGTLVRNSDSSFYARIADTDKAGVSAYADLCREAGFTEDISDGEGFFYANNSDGFHVSVRYEGNNVMSIDVSAPDDEEPEEPSSSSSTSSSSSSTPEQPDTSETPAPEPEPEPESPSSSTPPAPEPPAASEPAAPDSSSGVAASAPETSSTPEIPAPIGMRPEFKEAMDSYEAFYDEYCDFMLKYSQNPSDLSLIQQYSAMNARLAEMTDAFNAWETEGGMNTAEATYYAEVSFRVAQKLADVSQSMASDAS